MNPLEKIAAIKSTIGHLSYDIRASYTNGVCLRQLHAESKSAMLFLLANSQSPDPVQPIQGATELICTARGEGAGEFVRLTALLDLAESSELFKSAEATIKPMLAEIAKIEGQLQAADEIRAGKAAALAAAEDQAAEAARQAAENDPVVIACKAALDALDAPVKPKGKVPAEVHEDS